MSAVKSKQREYSPEEREAYKAEKRETERKRIEESVRQLLNSEGWARWAETRATFHDYSLGNCMLIASQMPEASTPALRKHTVFMPCDRHAAMLATETRYRRAEVMAEGGYCSPCTGQGCEMKPGRDFFTESFVAENPTYKAQQ